MKTLKHFPRLLILVACCVASAASSAEAQATDALSIHKDIAYDDVHAAQKLDVYLAKADKPLPAMVFIHGGGWRAGSKAHVPGWLMQGVRKGMLFCSGGRVSLYRCGPSSGSDG